MLSRNELINIMKESETKINRENIDLVVIKSILESILGKLNSVQCISDARFIPYGRMEDLKEEIGKNLDEKKYIDAYFNISDFLSDLRISLNNSPEIVDKNKEYYNEDNICKEEKEILIEMINKYLSSINSEGKMENNENKQSVFKKIGESFKKMLSNNSNNKELKQKVQDFAKEQGYKKAVYLNDWNGYKCYEPIFDKKQPSFTGLPLIILVDKDNNIRMSTSDEALQQIRDKDKN